MEDPISRKEMGFFILAEEKIRLWDFNKLIATSWRKTTRHGSRRTTHGEKRRVMETINKRLQIASRAALPDYY
jgi:N6-adenosine-specific RNA methylase IME4